MRKGRRAEAGRCSKCRGDRPTRSTPASVSLASFLPPRPRYSRAAVPASPKKRRPRLLVAALLAIALLITLVLIPATFRLGLRTLLQLQSWRAGTTLTLNHIEGSLFKNIVLRDAILEPRRSGGTEWRVHFHEIEADFAWRLLFTRDRTGWLRDLTIDGLDTKIVLGTTPGPGFAPAWLPTPVHIEIDDARLLILRGPDTLRVEDAHFTASTMEPGEISIDRLTLQHPFFTRTFERLTGATAIHDRRLAIGRVPIAEHLALDWLTVGLRDQRLDLSYKVAAFSGELTGDLATRLDGTLDALQAAGRFGSISIPQLADFLGTTETTGGTIRDGNFRYGGDPGSLPQALRVRLDATDFQWGARRWESLILGAALLDGRLDIPELRLVQADNDIALDGHLRLDPARHWWQSDFDFNFAARIGSLGELSVLFGPEFADASGKINLDGSVRGSGESFAGQLIATGSHITYRGAPLDTLRAAARIQGNELQLSHLEFIHGDDYLRAQGVVNILGRKRYYGEVKASIANLATYAAFLQPPIAPRPFAGGIILDWSGEGAIGTHSGTFRARFAKIRALDDSDPQSHPIDAELAGTYSPANVSFNTFTLADTDTSLDARVIVGPQSVRLEKIRLLHQRKPRLEGDAILPFSVWHAWSQSGQPLWDLDGPARLALTATALDLHELALLTGRRLPLGGTLSANIAGDAPALRDLALEGRVTLRDGEIPSLADMPALDHIDLDLVLDQRRIVVEKASAQLAGDTFTARGVLDCRDLAAPILQGEIQIPRLSWHPFPGVTTHLALAGKVTGPLATATLTGAAQLTKIEMPDKAAKRSSLTDEPLLHLDPVPPIRFPSAVFRNWQLDLPITGTAHVKPAGSVTLALHLRGPARAPILTGLATATSLPFADLTLDTATLFLTEPPRLALTYTTDTGHHILLGPSTSPQTASILAGEAPPPPSDIELSRARSGDDPSPEVPATPPPQIQTTD